MDLSIRADGQIIVVDEEMREQTFIYYENGIWSWETYDFQMRACFGSGTFKA